MSKVVDGLVLTDEEKSGGSGSDKTQGIHAEFASNPERFRPTSMALYMAYSKTLGETHALSVAGTEGRRRIVEESIKNGALKSIFVEVNRAHGFSEWQHPQSYNVVAIKGDTNERVEKCCYGIDLFRLIERIPEPE